MNKMEKDWLVVREASSYEAETRLTAYFYAQYGWDITIENIQDDYIAEHGQALPYGNLLAQLQTWQKILNKRKQRSQKTKEN